MDQSATPAPLCLLVVDDYRDTADALACVLRSMGHEARAVYDGPSALRAVEERAPDVIIQDLQMPGMDGYEIARQVRRRGAAKDAMLVAVSGYPRPELRREEAAGFHRFLTKPLGLAALQKIVRSASVRRERKQLVLLSACSTL